MAGRIGSGVSFVRDKILQNLRTYEYDVDIVDVTEIMEQFKKQLDDDTIASIDADVEEPIASAKIAAATRVRRLQLLGNALRRKFGNGVLAALSATDFILRDFDDNNPASARKAYVIDSLKHPEEVTLLRRVFGNQFWMIGVVSSDLTRFGRLGHRKSFSQEVFEFLSEEDAHGDDKYDPDRLLRSGQAAVKTVLEADYFFANDFATKDEIEADAGRLLRLIFGVQVVSPTEEEVGMNAAYQASLRSACLSRQVGAAIVSDVGEILSTGHNDVPKYGGGLYGPHPSGQDRRCWAFGGKCYNDEEKLRITQQVVDLLVDKKLLDAAHRVDAIKELRKSRISGLIEFSRAVHAEMEAMLSIARKGAGGIIGSTLFTTTYPCHNCAKHIVDAGIGRVVYLEPYEKSLARRLHPDAINDPRQERDSKKVSFDNYGGISPRRFSDVFLQRSERKSDGSFRDTDRNRHGLFPIVREEVATVLERIDCLQQRMEGEAESSEFADSASTKAAESEHPKVLAKPKASGPQGVGNSEI